MPLNLPFICIFGVDKLRWILIDFVRGSAISSTKEGKSGFIYNLDNS